MGVLFALTGMLEVTLSLRIAAFNIRTFGEAKISNATLANYITQVSPHWLPLGAEEPGWLGGATRSWSDPKPGREGEEATGPSLMFCDLQQLQTQCKPKPLLSTALVLVPRS